MIELGRMNANLILKLGRQSYAVLLKNSGERTLIRVISTERTNFKPNKFRSIFIKLEKEQPRN